MKRTLLFSLACIDIGQTIKHLQEVELYARVNGFPPPVLEAQKDGDVSAIDVYEEILSDQSRRLVAMFV